MCESYCVIVDIEVTCGDEKECEDLKNEMQEKYGLISGIRDDSTIFIRGSGIVISEKLVITSAVLFPNLYPQYNGESSTLRCHILAGSEEKIIQSGRLIHVVSFVTEPLKCVSGVAVIELDEKIPNPTMDISLSQPPPLSGALIEVRGGGAFGHPVFDNPLFSGIVSGVAHKAGIMLLDVRAPPGLEGALVARVPDGPPVGILLHSLFVGKKIYPLSLAVSLERFYDNWKHKYSFSKPAITPLPDKPDEGRKVYVETCAKTVFLSSAKAWATGIIISPEGHIVTCAHFLRASAKSPICATLASNGAPLGITRVISSLPHSIPWDAVILKCAQSMKECEFYDIYSHEWNPPLGTTAYVIGYHLLQPRPPDKIGPLCLRGKLAKIITIGGHHVMYMVSAPSFFGASGGPVVCSKGRLIGICVSNIEGSGQTPSVCLVLPVSILKNMGSFSEDYTPEQQEQIRALWHVELNFDLPKASEIRKVENFQEKLIKPKL